MELVWSATEIIKLTYAQIQNVIDQETINSDHQSHTTSKNQTTDPKVYRFFKFKPHFSEEKISIGNFITIIMVKKQKLSLFS